jgi:hypothetical protein
VEHPVDSRRESWPKRENILSATEEDERSIKNISVAMATMMLDMPRKLTNAG